MDNESMGTPQSLENRLDDLDEITLDDYPWRIDLRAAVLIDPVIDPEEATENVRSYIEDQLSDLPSVVEAEVRRRD